jgi:integrase
VNADGIVPGMKPTGPKKPQVVEAKSRGLGRVFQRGSVWWIQYSFRGEQHRESSHSTAPRKAVSLLKRRMAEMGRGRLVGPQAERLTFGDLARMVVEDYQINARKSAPPLKRLAEHFPDHTRALDITADAVKHYIQQRLVSGAAPATVKNEVGALGRAFTLAYRSGLLPHRPYLPSPRVNNARTGFFTGAEVKELLKHMPEYLRPFVEAAYITGWRRGELRSLRWSQVDWESGTIRLERGTTKSGEPRSFPFAVHPRLTMLLQEQRELTFAFDRESESVCPWVFHRQGHQVSWYYDAWKTACRKAGVPGRLLHDLRRSAVRNLVRAGASEQVSMSITGHKTRSVFDRYHIVSSSDQIEAVRKLATFHGAVTPEPRKVVAIGDTLAARTGTVRGQSGSSRHSARPQVPAPQWRKLASPTGFEPVSPP